MGCELILAPEVVEDLDNAYFWYEDRRPGLGQEFLTAVEASLEAIRRTPGIYATIHENYRRGLVRRFPYMIFYEHLGDVVTVYGVFHTARDPRTWRLRLRRAK